MTRVKKTLITETITVDDADAAFGMYADADAREKKILADMDVKITQLRERYQEELARLKELKDQKFELLQHYAVTNPEVFAKKKSVEMTHGIIGFRTGTPKLSTRKGYTWAAILSLVKEFIPDYIRTVEEVAKDRILADREQEVVSANLNRVGIEIKQNESFYVEPKKELAV